MHVRTAVADDLPALRELFRRSSLSNPDDVEVLLAHPEALVLPDTEVLGGSHAGWPSPRTARSSASRRRSAAGPVRELEDLFVDPDHQRHGIGALLVADAVDLARRDGAATASR